MLIRLLTGFLNGSIDFLQRSIRWVVLALFIPASHNSLVIRFPFLEELLLASTSRSVGVILVLINSAVFYLTILLLWFDFYQAVGLLEELFCRILIVGWQPLFLLLGGQSRHLINFFKISDSCLVLALEISSIHWWSIVYFIQRITGTMPLLEHIILRVRSSSCWFWNLVDSILLCIWLDLNICLSPRWLDKDEIVLLGFICVDNWICHLSLRNLVDQSLRVICF